MSLSIPIDYSPWGASPSRPGMTNPPQITDHVDGHMTHPSPSPATPPNHSAQPPSHPLPCSHPRASPRTTVPYVMSGIHYQPPDPPNPRLTFFFLLRVSIKDMGRPPPPLLPLPPLPSRRHPRFTKRHSAFTIGCVPNICALHEAAPEKKKWCGINCTGR